MPDHLILQADARRVPVADRSVHCFATSVPYYGLRDYGTGRWEGGDPTCEHKRTNFRQDHSSGDWLGTRGEQAGNAARATPYRNACGRCGATRIDLQIGMEPSPDDYLATMVLAFREVHRVLRDDGTLWLNIGDCYANDAKGPRGHDKSTLSGSRTYQTEAVPPGMQKGWRSCSGLKKKDLMLMPARLALALQADGWYLRQEITWHKRNVMPESVRDRPGRSHEVVYLLTKRPRYFYDDCATRSRQGDVFGAAERTVWSITTKPFRKAHFATMPVDLAARCIRMGTSERGVCPTCGAPWRRVVERRRVASRPDRSSKYHGVTDRTNHDRGRHVTEVRHVGWEPGCACGVLETVPAVVGDFFGGALTTSVAAEALGRDSIVCDLSRDYLLLGRDRLERPHVFKAKRPAPSEPILPLFARRAR